MWTNQVYGHDDKMARTKTHITSQNTEYTKTQHAYKVLVKDRCLSEAPIYFRFSVHFNNI